MNFCLKSDYLICLGTASVARSYSNYLDYLLDNKIENFFSKYRGIDIFETLLSHNFQLAIRATALVSDLLAETSSNSTNHNDLIQIINSSDICSKISNIFESDLDKYNLITLLESSTTILKSTNCRQYFQLNLLEKFQLKYSDDDFVLETVRTFAKQLPNHKEEL